MTWKAVWEANLAYDLQCQNLDEGVLRRFTERVHARLRATNGAAAGAPRDAESTTDAPRAEATTGAPPEDEHLFLQACEEVLNSEHEFLLRGRETRTDNGVRLACVRTLRALREYHCEEESVGRGAPTDDYLEWFRKSFTPSRLRRRLSSRRPIIWLTLAEALDRIVATESTETVASIVRDRLALGKDTDEHYVRIDVPRANVEAPLRAPTTFDGGTRSAFVANADEDGWGWTCDTGCNELHLPEAVARSVKTDPKEPVDVRYLGRAAEPHRDVDPTSRADFLRQRLARD